MALSRRRFLLAVPLTGLGAACSASCSSSRPVIVGAAGPIEIATWSPPGAAAKGTILVAMPETMQTREVWSGLKDELEHDYRLVAVRVEGPRAAIDLAAAMARYRPDGVVLMNNPTVAAYRAYQDQAGIKRFPPAVVVMTSFFDSPTLIASATGISYEVPLITAVTNLRKVIASPIERVGVVARPSQRGFVQRQAALAAREQITVVAQEVSASPNASEVKWALRKLKHRIDALWVLNDDRLLTPRLIADGWLPGLNEPPYCATIVGAAALVSPRQSFGTFAVLPDHTALGVQAAGILFDLAENGWSVPPDRQVQLPLSTTTTMDLVQVRERFSLREGALQHVDRILE